MSYPGGKNGAGVYQKIINMLPPHTTYIEPFLGEGAIMRNKRLAQRSFGFDLDPEVIARWKSQFLPAGVTVKCDDALEVLASWKFEPSTLVYLDPPYVMSSRSCKRPLYRFEFSDKDHRALLNVAKQLPCLVVISGYKSELYNRELSGWRVETFKAMTRGGRMANEYVWMNYPRPIELHDYQYLGDGFRERERIKRKRQRWQARLKRMPELERQAILWAFQDLITSPVSTMGARIAISDGAGPHRHK